KFNFAFIANLKHAGDGLFNRARLKSSLPMALLLALIILVTYVPWLIWQSFGGFWAAVTCFFIIEERILGIIGKGKLRFGAHVLAATIGLVGVLLSLLYPPLQIVTLCFGYVLAGYIMVNAKSLSHSGNTFAIAITIMLLYGPEDTITIEAILSRFSYVLAGVIVGFLATRLLSNYIQKTEQKIC
ncbi:FUSC family protein, partial [Francisellaceae bacterium]|nr:FUSC family protein [Francisellaceae bacterium]